MSFPLHARARALQMLCIQGLKKFSSFQGSCGACKGSKCCTFQGVVRVYACRDSKCFNIQDLAILKVLCMQGSIDCYFLGFRACRSSMCLTFQGCMHERAPNAARSASLPGISCTQGFHMLQFPGNLAHKDSKCSICQGLKCPNFPKLCVHHWSACRLYRLGSKNGPSGQFLIQTWATPLVKTTRLFLQSIFRERTNIEYV